MGGKETYSSEKNYFLGIDGVPVKTIPENGKDFLTYNQIGFWSLPDFAIFDEIETKYFNLYSQVEKKLWGSTREYVNTPISLEWKNVLESTGLNPQSELSKNDFNKMLSDITDNNDKNLVNKYLYTTDVFCLISNIQEVSNELFYLSGEFYYILNFDSYSTGLPKDMEQGVIISKSPLANKLIGLMTLIFVRCHSLLDYFTKLAYELENINLNFNSYPKLSSSKKIYRHKKNLKINDIEGTLFKRDSFINKIEAYRNALIHDGLLDDTPRIHKRYEHGKLVERYILLPDTKEDGFLETHVNRRFFYSQEVKFNLILPDLLRTFQKRQLKTLKLISENVILP